MTKPRLWTRNFLTINIINFLIFINHMILLSPFPFYIDSLGGNEALAGLSSTLFSVVSVLLRPFVGWMLDNGRRRVILLVGLCGLTIVPLGYIAFSVLYLAMLCRAVHGAFLATANTASGTIATDIVPKTRFAEGMGMFGLATALASAFAPALGLYFMKNHGYPVLFLATSISAVIALVLFFLLKTPPMAVERKPLNFKVLFEANALPASATMLVFLLTYGALEHFIAKFASEYGLISGGIFFVVMAATLMLVRFTLGRVADRKGEAVFVYCCNASMFIALLLLALFPSNATLIAASVLAGFGFGGIEPALLSMAVHIAPPNRRGSANSTFFCAYDIGIGFGSGIAGALISLLGYQQMFAILSAANIASVMVYVLWARKHPSSLSGMRRMQAAEGS